MNLNQYQKAPHYLDSIIVQNGDDYLYYIHIPHNIFQKIFQYFPCPADDYRVTQKFHTIHLMLQGSANDTRVWHQYVRRLPLGGIRYKIKTVGDLLLLPSSVCEAIGILDIMSSEEYNLLTTMKELTE